MAIGDYFNYDNLFGSVPSALKPDIPEYITKTDPTLAASLANKGFGQGLLGLGLTALTQPYNKGYGSILPYFGKPLLAFAQQSDAGVESGLKDFILSRKLEAEDLKIKQERRKQSAINELLAMPEVANNPALRAFILDNPDDAAKLMLGTPKGYRDQGVYGVKDPDKIALYEALKRKVPDQKFTTTDGRTVAVKDATIFEIDEALRSKGVSQNVNVEATDLGVIADLLKPEGLEKTVTVDLQKSLITSEDNLAKLDDLSKSFKPEFLTYPYKLDTAITDITAKLGLLKPNDPNVQEDMKRVTALADFQTQAYNYLNAYIKAMTGAQMSEPEAKRLKKGIPDPENDSFLRFQSKLDRNKITLLNAAERVRFILANGLGDRVIVESVINDETGELEKFMFIKNEDGSKTSIESKFSLDDMERLKEETFNNFVKNNSLDLNNMTDQLKIHEYMKKQFGVNYRRSSQLAQKYK